MQVKPVDSFRKPGGILATLAVLGLTAGLAYGEIITVTYQVSAGADDGYAWSATEQDISSDHLIIGDGKAYTAPYYMSGMRFTNVAIPRSAAIVEAHLKISSINEGFRGRIYGVIQAESADEAADFSSRYIAAAAKTTAAVNWDHKSAWDKNTWQTSDDISTVIQEVVDRPGWSSGNSLALFYATRTDSGKSRMFASFEGALAAVLEVTYETYTISGHVLTTEATPLENVTVSAGADIESDVTDATGYYEIRVPPGWSGIVTASKTEWGFTEWSHSYTNVASDLVNQDFTAFQPKIPGYITDNGAGLEGVLVSADNGGGSDTTDPNGYYQLIVPYDWSGTVTVSKLLWGFSPESKEYSNITSNQTNQNYTAFPPPVISGVVTVDANGVEGVSVSADNGGASDTTDTNGYYEIILPYDWSGTITPSQGNLYFSPQNRSYTNVISDLVDENYSIIAHPTTTKTYQVSSATDDGYAAYEGHNRLAWDWLFVGYPEGASSSHVPYYMSGMRFRDVEIPQAAFIRNAYLQIRTPGMNQLMYAETILHAEATDNAVSFTVSTISQRIKTNASTHWYIAPWYANKWYNSPDIRNAVQEVINREGWNSGNAMVILHSNNADDYDLYHYTAYDRNSSYAPKLKITYDVPRWISGYVQKGDGTAVPDVTVTVDNGGRSGTTDINGYYKVSVPSGWSGTISLAKQDWAFEETTRAYSNVVLNLLTEDRLAFSPPVISGYIVDSNGLATSGVFISTDDGTDSTSSDGNGYYELIVPQGWSGVVTPTRLDWAYGFIPKDRSYVDLITDQSYQNYVYVEVPPEQIYVDSSATGNNDGSSWNNAYNYLQDALAAASITQNNEILVAEGVYKPDQGMGVTAGERTESFSLLSGVAIFGGFPSGGGTWEQRNPNKYEVILSGDLNGDDLNFNNNNENSYNLVVGNGIDETATLDGFTISGGNANNVQGGKYKGGGMFISSGDPTIGNCTFKNNAAHTSGGFYSYHSSFTMTNCRFINNYATNRGSAVYIWAGTPSVTNCIFTENYGPAYSGVYLTFTSPNITNCLFSRNSSRVIYVHDSTPMITNCTICDNSGTGIDGSQGHVVLTNSILWKNGGEDQSSQIGGGSWDINYSCIQGWTGDLGGIGNISDDPNFAFSGDYHLQSQAGRWDPNTETWVYDDVNSPCIDAGDPNSDWTLELWPHGKRINIGAYGGTPEASMSLSNAGNIADLNTDGFVDYIDIRLFTGEWLCKEVLLAEDLDRNGIVNFTDFALLADNLPWEE